jgi:hypothetical protein
MREAVARAIRTAVCDIPIRDLRSA